MFYELMRRRTPQQYYAFDLLWLDDIVKVQGPTRNRGLELLATWCKSPFTATASYTDVRASELEPSGRADVPLTPRLEYNPYRDSSVPYVLVGAMAEHKVAAHVKLFLNLEDLTNVRQTRWDPLLLPTPASDGRWTVDAWAPLDGRVINGGARFSFLENRPSSSSSSKKFYQMPAFDALTTSATF
jgi:outer membrane receptor for ferrienterochelin and colicins